MRTSSRLFVNLTGVSLASQSAGAGYFSTKHKPASPR